MWKNSTAWFHFRTQSGLAETWGHLICVTEILEETLKIRCHFLFSILVIPVSSAPTRYVFWVYVVHVYLLHETNCLLTPDHPCFFWNVSAYAYIFLIYASSRHPFKSQPRCSRHRLVSITWKTAFCENDESRRRALGCGRSTRNDDEQFVMLVGALVHWAIRTSDTFRCEQAWSYMELSLCLQLGGLRPQLWIATHTNLLLPTTTCTRVCLA